MTPLAAGGYPHQRLLLLSTGSTDASDSPHKRHALLSGFGATGGTEDAPVVGSCLPALGPPAPRVDLSDLSDLGALTLIFHEAWAGRAPPAGGATSC